MKQLITALILVATAAGAQAGTYGDVALKEVKTAQFIYDQCTNGTRSDCTDSQKMRQVCFHIKVARQAAAQDGDKAFYQTLDRNVKQVCGPNE